MSTNLLKTSVLSLSLLALVPLTGGAHASDNESEANNASVSRIQSQAHSPTQIEAENVIVAEAPVTTLDINISPEMDDFEFDDKDCEIFKEGHFDGDDKFTSTNVNMVKDGLRAVVLGVTLYNRAAQLMPTDEVEAAPATVPSDLPQVVRVPEESIQVRADRLQVQAEETEKIINTVSNEISEFAKCSGRFTSRFIYYTDQILPSSLYNWIRSPDEVVTVGEIAEDFELVNINGNINSEEKEKEAEENIIEELADTQY
jgi:virulence-associated protein VagC